MSIEKSHKQWCTSRNTRSFLLVTRTAAATEARIAAAAEGIRGQGRGQPQAAAAVVVKYAGKLQEQDGSRKKKFRQRLSEI